MNVEHNPGEPDFGEKAGEAEHNPGEPELGEEDNGVLGNEAAEGGDSEGVGSNVEGDVSDDEDAGA